MIDSKSKPDFINLLDGEAYSIQDERNWQILQETFRERGLHLILYEANPDGPAFWKCLFDKIESKYDDFVKEPLDYPSYSLRQNIEKSIFTESTNTRDRRIRRNLSKYLVIKGLFIPASEFNRISFEKLKNAIDCIIILSDSISFSQVYVPFLVENRNSGDAIEKVFDSWWLFLMAYKDALLSYKGHKNNDLEDWISSRFSLQNLKMKLPSEQIVSILIYCLERIIFKSIGTPNINKKLEKCSDAVSKFFDSHLHEIEQALDPNVEYDQSFYFNEKMRKDFISVFQHDLSLLRIQEILDNHGRTRTMESLSVALQKQLNPMKGLSIKKRFQSLLTPGGILTRIQENAEEIIREPEPMLFEEAPPIASPKVKQWWEVEEDVIDDVQSELEHLAEKKKALDLAAKDRWLKHLKILGDRLSAPFFIWKQEKETLVPQINILDDVSGREYFSNYWKKLAWEKWEYKRLKDLSKSLFSFASEREINDLLKKMKPFTIPRMITEWERKLQEQRAKIRQRESFRKQKMMSFGIWDDKKVRPFKKEIWLDEMLEIEEDVSPYINFVKKAFLTALPVRKHVVFDEYRHSADGVEFDPETVFNMEKWMNAEVMKTMSYKIDRGEVIQVNSFALDFSGSMDHVKMRSLFKILYLLLLGLEDKKSYDSIHFFASGFIECANFSGQYTSRRLLFQVLKQISVVRSGEVFYGGYGGTNISSGIENCHERLLNFSQILKDKNPQHNFVHSIFVISDGEPSLGIINLEELSEFVNKKRSEGNVSIKGIYIKPEDDETEFIGQIFGDGNYVESVSFNDGVSNFVKILTDTYKAQRKAFKWEQKRKRIQGAK